MRRLLTLGALALALAIPLAAGCHLLPNRDRNPAVNPPPATGTPDAPALVNYLNLNAQKIQSIQASVALDARQGRQPIGLDGEMACQKPRDFRLRAKVLGQPAVDIGSNDKEFWYWISKAEPPYVYHCSYEELGKGKVRVPFPFQPDMVMAALNLAEYDPKARYEVKVTPATRTTPGTLELWQDAIAPNGQPVKRITVFNKNQVQIARGQPQVVAHILKDAKGTLICQASVQKVEVNRATGAIIPTRVKIEWPAQTVSMDLMLSDVRVNGVDKEVAGAVFQRTALNRYDSFDLARQVVDTAGGVRRATAR